MWRNAELEFQPGKVNVAATWKFFRVLWASNRNFFVSSLKSPATASAASLRFMFVLESQKTAALAAWDNNFIKFTSWNMPKSMLVEGLILCGKPVFMFRSVYLQIKSLRNGKVLFQKPRGGRGGERKSCENFTKQNLVKRGKVYEVKTLFNAFWRELMSCSG